MVSLASVTVGAYLNAQLAYMLEDKSMFSMPADQIGQLTSELTVASLPFSMVTTCAVSFIFEIVGRKLTLFFSFFFTGILFFLLPYTAPNYFLLTVARCLLGVTMSAPLAHPLIPDYVRRESRGAAIAVAGVGIVLGEVFSMGILFNLTKSMSYYDAFLASAMLIFSFSIFFLYSVQDPALERIRNAVESRHSVLLQKRLSRLPAKTLRMQRRTTKSRSLNIPIEPTNLEEKVRVPISNMAFASQKYYQQVLELMNIAIIELKENPVLFISMVGASITRLLSVLFSTYLILWIQTFVNGDGGNPKLL